MHGAPLGNPPFIVGLVCGLLWCGAMLIAMSLRTRLTLTPRTLRWRKVFGTWEVARSDITGYRTWYDPFRNNSTNFVFLYVRNQRRAEVTIPGIFDDDGEFFLWLKATEITSQIDQRSTR